MGAPCPPHWTFAARAAYFGDRMCAFCDHRNPPGAKFCNDCASPLQLKPCPQCDAVSDQAATNCYKCGATYPVLFNTEATPVSTAADRTLSWATPGDVAVAATRTEPLFAASGSRAGWRLLLAAIPTILVAGGYAAHHMGAAPPVAWKVVSQPISEREDNTPGVMMSAAPVAVESRPVEPERTDALQASVPATNLEAPKRASVRQRPAPAARAPVRAIPPVKPSLAGARVSARVAETSRALQPHPWQLMHASLARCDGDLIDRIVCELRVRRQFCQGHWGEAPVCASSINNDHGQ